MPEYQPRDLVVGQPARRRKPEARDAQERRRPPNARLATADGGV
jgi:hypothetical protein